MSSNGRAMIEGCAEGFAKVVASAEAGTILGVQLAGPSVTEMISGMAGLVAFEADTDDAAGWFFAHPSVSETIHDAVLDINGQSINK